MRKIATWILVLCLTFTSLNVSGNQTYANEPEPEIVEIPSLENMMSIHGYSASITDGDNNLLYWGSGYKGNGEETSTFPEKLYAIEKAKGVVEVTYGKTNRGYIDNEGNIVLWGKNDSGQFGNGVVSTESIPFESRHTITNITNVKKAIVGNGSIALKEDGTVWTWGKSKDTINPLYESDVIHTPTQVEGLENIVDIEVGSWFFLALDSNGNVFSWGWDRHGQLGLSWTDKYYVPHNGSYRYISTPTLIASNIKKIETSDQLSFAINENNELYKWGGYDNHSIGEYPYDSTVPWNYVGGSKRYTQKLLPVENLTNIKDISIGRNHVMALTESGEIYTWGSNREGVLGNNNKDFYENFSIDNPQKIEIDTKFISIYTGSDTAFALDINGNLWSWGENDSSQQGNGKFDYATPSNQAVYYYPRKMLELDLNLNNVEKKVELSGLDSKQYLNKRDNEKVDSNSLEADPIDTASGSLIINENLLTISKTKNLGIDLHYNSLNADKNFGFGNGWSYNYNISAERFSSSKVKIKWPYFSESTYYLEKPETFQYASIDDNGDKYSVTGASGTNATYSIIDKKGTNYKISSGKLVRITYPNNSYIEQSFNSGIIYKTIFRNLKSEATTYETYKYVNNTISDGLVTKLRDGNGKTVLLEYDESKNLTKITYPNGSTKSYTYNENNQIITATDSDGIVYMKNEYDDKGRVIKQYDSFNNTTLFSYMEDTLIGKVSTTVTDREGHSKILIHDQSYNLIEEIDKARNSTKHHYDSENNRIKTIYPNETSISMEYDERNNLIKITDQLNNSVSMEYDAKNNLIKTTNSNGDYLVNTYDDKNQLTSVKDSNNYEVIYNYSNGYLTSTVEPNDIVTTYQYKDEYLHTKTDPMGNKSIYTTDYYGNILTETDPLGNQTTYTYDLADNLKTQKNPLEQVMSMTYDSHNQITSLIDYKGITTHYNYDVNGNLVKEEKEGKLESYSYNKENSLTKLVTPRGFTESTTVDKLGQIIQTIDGNNLITNYDYDSVGNLISRTVDGSTTTYSYDAANNLISVLNAEGYKTSFEYNSLKQLIKETDASGNSTLHTYDYNGNLVSTTDSLGNVIKHEYNPNNKILQTTDAKGNSLTYSYNKNNQLIKVTDALGGETQYNYDANGNLIELINAVGAKVQYSYDNLNRLIKTTDPLGHTTRNTYDENGNIVENYDSKENLIYSYEYDSFNNPIKVKNALNHTVTNTFDKEDNLATVVDSLNRKTEFLHDSKGQVITTKDANVALSTATYNSFSEVKGYTDNNTNETIYLYDKLGQLLEERNATGNKLVYTYDAVGNLKSKKNGRDQETIYTYDSVGNLIKASNAETDTEYFYDANYNLIETSETILSSSKVNSIKRKYDALNRMIQYEDQFGNIILYEYDAIGNLTKLIYPDSKEVTYTYDLAGNMTSVIDWNGDKTTYLYDSNNSLVGTNLPNGTRETRSYDQMGQVLKITHVNSQDEVIKAFTETYDAVGNVIKENENVYSYDNLNRLIGANNIDYSYDAAGNLLTVLEDNNISLNMGYGLDNQLNMYREISTAFDNDGNLLTIPNSETLSNAIYDINNRLISLDQDTYLYNAENQRISTTENGKETQFVISSHEDLDQILMETDNEGNPLAYYVYGKGLISKKTVVGESLYYHFDRRGSTVALTNNEGIVTDTIEYDIYGEILLKEGDTENRFLYNGQYGVQTDSSGLYYMRARYYSPELKRFINRDIVSGTIDNSQTFNRYAFVNGNPVSFIDPFGLSRQADSKKSSFLDGLQVGLSLAGFVPVFGEAFDVLNAGVSLFRGNYADAALNMSSAIPLIGNGIAVGKLGSKLYKTSKLNPCDCLVAGTIVVTKTGEIAIENIEVGDRVLSKNEETGEINYKTVTGLFSKTSEELYTISIGSEKIVATGEHPFWAEGKGWVLAEELKNGDFFLDSTGQQVEITDITKSEEQVEVYNFEVEGFHTYFVSDSKIWTHNCKVNTQSKGSYRETQGYEKTTLINGKYAGKNYQLEDARLQNKYPNGVDFDEYGFPDFNPYKIDEIESDKLIGTSKDFNKSITGRTKPAGYTWHHQPDGKTMLLVPTDIHFAVKHTGGAYYLRNN